MTQLLQNAAYGTVLILAVALLRRVLGDRLVPEARLALWAVCLFRLLTPAAPGSALSLWGPLSRLFRTAAPASAAPSASRLYVLPREIPAPEPDIPWKTVLVILWLAVGGALAVRYALSWRRTRRAVACAIPLNRDDGRYAALPKCARLREGPMEGAPLTFGALRPTVVLYPGLSGAELDCVLAHEGIHARRRDNLWHYAAAAALTVFWWDPAVWLMARLIRRDVELSCDRAAVRRLGADRRAEYANALITLSTQAEGGAFCHGFGSKRTEERIIAIMKYKKTTIIGMALTLALVLGLTAAFASEPKTPSDEYDGVKDSAQTVVTTDGADPDLLTYIEVEGDIEGVIMGEGEIRAVSYKILSSDYEVVAEGEMSCDGAPAINYSVLTSGHDGAAVDVVTGSIGSSLYSYSVVDDKAADGITGPYFCSYSVKDAETAEDIVVRLVGADGDSNAIVYSYSICDDADCGVAGPHAHMNGQVIYVECENPYAGVEAE